jgi:hypothetical protein
MSPKYFAIHQPSAHWHTFINYIDCSILKLDPTFYGASFSASRSCLAKLLKKVFEKNRGEDLKTKLRKVGTAFLNKREVSAQEAAFRILSLPLKKKPPERLCLSTPHPKTGVSLLKKKTFKKTLSVDRHWTAMQQDQLN